MKLPPTPATAAADDDDNLPAFLRNRPRVSPLSAPPAAYFDELPARVLTRIRAEALKPAPARFTDLLPIFDLSSLRWPRLRVAFASAALSAAFVGAFWLGQTGATQLTPASSDRVLAGVNSAELVEYLADPATAHLTAADLNTLSAADIPTDSDLLSVPRADLDAALDELPLDETYF